MEAIFFNIINDALWSPTPDNIQNWRFHLSPEGFTVALDTPTTCHYFDQYHNASIISLGALSAYIEVAASNRGYKANIHFDNNEIQVTLSPEETLNKNFTKLYPFIKSRRTDRRGYKPTPCSDELTYELLETNKNYSSKVHFSAKPNKDFFNYLFRTEQIFWKQYTGIFQTLKYIGFSKEPTKIGMNYSNTSMNRLEAFVLKSCSNSKLLFTLMLKFGGSFINVRKFFSAYKKSAGFLLFTISDLSHKSLFEAGAHATHCWLIATKHGFVAQPLSFSSLTCYENKKDNVNLSYISDNPGLFEDGCHTLNHAFSAPANETPCWLLRIGASTPMNRQMIPVRQSAKDYIAQGKLTADRPITEEKLDYASNL